MKKSELNPFGRTQKESSHELDGQAPFHRRCSVDSTGLKVYGEGEWKVRQHGVSPVPAALVQAKRRT